MLLGTVCTCLESHKISERKNRGMRGNVRRVVEDRYRRKPFAVRRAGREGVPAAMGLLCEPPDSGHNIGYCSVSCLRSWENNWSSVLPVMIYYTCANFKILLSCMMSPCSIFAQTGMRGGNEGTKCSLGTPHQMYRGGRSRSSKGAHLRIIRTGRFISTACC
jgi:hypothetical protein